MYQILRAVGKYRTRGNEISAAAPCVETMTNTNRAHHFGGWRWNGFPFAHGFRRPPRTCMTQRDAHHTRARMREPLTRHFVPTMSFPMTPEEIVSELDKHIVGQDAAKRAVAI